MNWVKKKYSLPQYSFMILLKYYYILGNTNQSLSSFIQSGWIFIFQPVCLNIFISKIVLYLGKIKIFASTTTINGKYVETSSFKMRGSIITFRDKNLAFTSIYNRFINWRYSNKPEILKYTSLKIIKKQFTKLLIIKLIH